MIVYCLIIGKIITPHNSHPFHTTQIPHVVTVYDCLAKK